MSLVPIADAMAKLLLQVPAPPEWAWHPLSESCGRVLAQSVMAQIDVPPFDNSAMDGYAVRAVDLPGELRVSQRVPAGCAPESLEPGTAARIFTGAPLPEGADTVIMQEDVLVHENRVTVLDGVSQGAHIRLRGCDIARGDQVLEAGRVLTPQDIGLAASVGCVQLPLRRPLRVAVITTGDELVVPGNPLQPGQIYNSNSQQIAAQLHMLGMRPVVLESLPDSPERIGDTLESTAADVDCVITCGGVSVGEEDHVRHQIEQRGRLALWRLAIKPGKPLAFGHIRGTPVFGLPGNPVSAWVTFAVLVKPWLLHAQGACVTPLHPVVARADFVIDRPGTREEFLRVELLVNDSIADSEIANRENRSPPRWLARLSGSQSSGVLSSVSRAEGLAVVPIGVCVAKGQPINVFLMSELLNPQAAGFAQTASAALDQES